MLLRAAARAAVFVIATGALLFGFSATVRWAEAWAFLAALIGIFMGTAAWLKAYDPALLAARLSSPVSADQADGARVLVAFIGLGFIVWLAAIGIDHRINGRDLPLAMEAAGLLLGGAGVALICWAFTANSFAAPQIRVQTERDQTVIDTGPYGHVRHPMYAGGNLLLIGSAMLLGSLWGLSGVALLIVGIAMRAVGEETLLRDELAGYADYERRVRYRLVPGVW